MTGRRGEEAAATVAHETAALAASLRKLQSLKSRADAGLVFADKALAAVKTDQARPRSSIIISDEPLSHETNYRTEFIAVLSNQPQGGFVTRQPTDDVAIESGNDWGDDGFESVFQPWNSRTSDTRRRGSQYYYPMQRGLW